MANPTDVGSADRDFAITPSDTTTFSPTPDGIFVGGAGTVIVRLARSSADTTYNAVAGSILPIKPIQVKFASTATGLIGLFNQGH